MPATKIAFFSPFNPVRSGVSDYSEELLPELGKRAEVALVADSYALTNRRIVKDFPVLSVDEFQAKSGDFRIAIYQVANSLAHHGYMIPCLMQHPGVVVLHDYYLHHLMLGLTLMRGDFRAVEQILSLAGNSNASSVARGLLLSTADPYGISLISPLLDRARAVITHSKIALDLVKQERPDLYVTQVPMAMPAIDINHRNQIRQQLNVKPGQFVLASVSTLSYTKRIEVVIEALKKLKDSRPSLQLWVLGGGQLGQQTLEYIRHSGLSERVWFSGWTEANEYERMLVAADAVVDLRYPSGAETSASLLRAIASGKPALVSAQGSFLELPDSFARKIEVNSSEVDALKDALLGLLDSPETTAAMSAAAYEYAHNHMRLDQAAQAYLDVAEHAAGVEPARLPTPLASNAGKAERTLFATIYRAGRAAFLFRKYGLRQTISRLRTQLGSRQS